MAARCVKTIGFCAALVGALVCSSPASAQATFTIDDDRFVGVGGGLRTSGRVLETSPGSGDYSQDVQLDNIRLYLNAGVHKHFGVEFNTEYDGTGDIEILDAVVKYSPSPYFNVWMGRHLPPSDRANLAGPFFALGFDYPVVVSGYPFITAGRDNGVMVNGQVGGGVFKYAGGVYEGATTLDGSDTMLWAGRVVYNFLDPEPGYYNNDTYYGEKQLLAVGFAVQRQADIALDPDLEVGDFVGMNVDVLFEQSVGNAGVVTLEGAAYSYDYNGGTGPTVVGIAVDGEAYLLAGAFLFPPTGPGRLQPYVRYQDFDPITATDIGVNYVIRGHSTRISAIYTRSGVSGAMSNGMLFGAQLQF